MCLIRRAPIGKLHVILDAMLLPKMAVRWIYSLGAIALIELILVAKTKWTKIHGLPISSILDYYILVFLRKSSPGDWINFKEKISAIDYFRLYRSDENMERLMIEQLETNGTINAGIYVAFKFATVNKDAIFKVNMINFE